MVVPIYIHEHMEMSATATAIYAMSTVRKMLPGLLRARPAFCAGSVVIMLSPVCVVFVGMIIAQKKKNCQP